MEDMFISDTISNSRSHKYPDNGIPDTCTNLAHTCTNEHTYDGREIGYT
jgi:hypothetical protein